ncbi:cation efflux protein [Trichocladium antarcticum]|uniref:Cation efflux protein n=1 Tax=Trichocladium antarcticum TaxID=1450529 RepID=A0AAN6UJN4_9PEZI|nr:cation efflux protein [Trichocladium antarcticum]
MAFKLSDKQKISVAIAISFAFFVCELVVAFKTGSLALMADAFHYLNDLVGFIVTLVTIIISDRSQSPQDLSFGWQRARLLGAFFNGAFLLALGISIFLQSIERFVSITQVEDPKLVLIVGCVGLALNIVTVAFLHEHHHHDSHHHGDPEREMSSGLTSPSVTAVDLHGQHRHAAHSVSAPGRDLGMIGAMLHVVGDALNNIGVIAVALIIWLSSSPDRFYADPAIGMAIALMILGSAMPLVKHSGEILLQSAPQGVNLTDVKHDIEQIPGIESVHELHVWRLDQKKAIASAHIVVSDPSVASFMEKAKTIRECLHAYGIHSTTIQPELAAARLGPETIGNEKLAPCQIVCGKGMCDHLMCCNTLVQV